MSEIINSQVTPGGMTPEGILTGTNMILPVRSTSSRFAHFPEEVYNLKAESHLVRFLRAVTGDAGAGQLRKRNLQSRLQQTLQGIHFYDLDKFYGALFGVRRAPSELLDLDPYTGTATSGVWATQHAKDASYRSRITQFARALTYGPTPTGIELAAEALLSVDSDVYETFYQVDAGRYTYAEIENDYPTYADMQGVLYADLEGRGLPILAGDERREFVVRPKRPVSQGEAHDLRRVLREIKPADSRFTIDTDAASPYEDVPLRGMTSDSDYWEVIPKVVTDGPGQGVYDYKSSESIEQPRPPFSAHQGEAWSYVGDVIGIAAFHSLDPARAARSIVAPVQRVTLSDGSYLEYPSHMALVPRRHLLAGRTSSDGVLVAHPYWASRFQTTPDLAPLFADRIEITALNSLLAARPTNAFPQNPVERFWASDSRPGDSPVTEIVEVSLAQARKINYASVEVSRYPHTLKIQTFQGSTWTTIYRNDVTESIPAYLPPGLQVPGHPQHAHPGHWERLSIKLDQYIETSSIRFLMTRIGGAGPTSDGETQMDYSLALRSLDVGYRVHSDTDVPEDALDGSEPIGSSLDPAGSRTEFYFERHAAQRMMDDNPQSWRSDPQPVNYAVVNLYLDTRTEDGDAQVVDTLFLDPLYSGAHLSIYWTEDLGGPEDGESPTDWYEDRSWRPVARDYRLQKGYAHFPASAARHIKLEFTALNAEQHHSMLTLTRKLRLFPQWLVEMYAHRDDVAQADLPPGMSTAIDIGDDRRYADALHVLRDTEIDKSNYLATESIYSADVQTVIEMTKESWALAFMPWHQGSAAPRFPRVGKHDYQVIEIQHDSQMAFFVGMRSVKALRTDPTQDENSLLYDEHFNDFRNIQEGFTWEFNPGRMETGLNTHAEATSEVYHSRQNVRAIQFATQQTEPVQVVPDDDMRDPALGTIDWRDNPDGWHRVGDATVVYSPLNHSTRIVRYSQPPMRKLDMSPGPHREVHHETFSYRPFVEDDGTQTAASYGGLESPLVSVSELGTTYGAIRLTLLTSLSNPLILQVTDQDGNVSQEHEITGVRGETIEQYYPFTPPATGIGRIRVIQRGISDDAWEVDRLSLFDAGIHWEFSVNGGMDWTSADGIRNNAYGILSFPEPGNQLCWRVTGMRPRMALTALRIRPHYYGLQNSRFNGVQRGPNVSDYDTGIPIQDDPMFTTWSGPIPRDWFLAYRQYPSLVSADGPTVTEFARFYGRPMEEQLAPASDVATRKIFFVRTGFELCWSDQWAAIYLKGVRRLWLKRKMVVPLPTPGVSAEGLVLPRSDWGPWNIVVHKP